MESERWEENIWFSRFWGTDQVGYVGGGGDHDISYKRN